MAKNRRNIGQGQFRKYNGEVIDNILQYVIDYINDPNRDKENISLHIGSDSQVHGTITNYAISICLYPKGKGVHVINRRDIEKTPPSMEVRLWKEVEKSIEVANMLSSVDIPIKIHIDYNIKIGRAHV